MTGNDGPQFPKNKLCWFFKNIIVLFKIICYKSVKRSVMNGATISQRVCIEMIVFYGTAGRQKLVYFSLWKYFGFIDVNWTVVLSVKRTDLLLNVLFINYFILMLGCKQSSISNLNILKLTRPFNLFVRELFNSFIVWQMFLLRVYVSRVLKFDLA